MQLRGVWQWSQPQFHPCVFFFLGGATSRQVWETDQAEIMFHIKLGGFHIMISGFHIILSGLHIVVSGFHIMCRMAQWKYHNGSIIMEVSQWKYHNAICI